MIVYLTVGLLVMVVVSLMTRPPDRARLDRVYECLRTPVAAGEPEVKPVTLPETTTPAPRSVLIDHPDFELMKPTRTSVVGFLATWVAVVALIAGFFWLLA
jgi:hypothetical protein